MLRVRLMILGFVLVLAAAPVLAQDAPGDSTPDQSQTQAQDQGAPSADDTSPAAPSPTPAATDPAAVIAQWGPAPSIGPEADRAVAERWFREQNTKRARWGVPTATRDPYLDWQAENLLRDRLGQPPLPQPPGLSKPDAVARSPQSDQAIYSETEFWTISDDLWQAWLDGIARQADQAWEESNPGQPRYTKDAYLQLFKWHQTPRFDRFRLMGVAGRVDTSNSPPSDLASGEAETLEQLAPGALAAYSPVVYPDNLVAVVGYDPWINPDGSLRP